MKKILRTGVLGLGRIAWHFHLPQICSHPGFELTAVMDPCMERLEEARKAFGVTGLYRDLDTMLKSHDLDLVVVASPTMFHAEQAIAAMQSGCDVFCDKPLTPSLKEAREIFNAAHVCKRKIMTYQPHRLNEEAMAVKSILESGKLGPVYLIERHIGKYARRNDWQAFKCNGGGMLINYGSHYIDQLLYLTGERVNKVRCDLRRIASLGDADDVVKAMITTNKQTLLEIDINQAVAIPLPEWRICGQYGTAVYQDRQWQLKYFLPGELESGKVDSNLAAAGRRYPEDNIHWHEETFAAKSMPGKLYYDYCYQYYAENHPPFVTESDIMQLIKTIEYCRQDAMLKKATKKEGLMYV